MTVQLIIIGSAAAAVYVDKGQLRSFRLDDKNCLVQCDEMASFLLGSGLEQRKLLLHTMDAIQLSDVLCIWSKRYRALSMLVCGTDSDLSEGLRQSAISEGNELISLPDIASFAIARYISCTNEKSAGLQLAAQLAKEAGLNNMFRVYSDAIRLAPKISCANDLNYRSLIKLDATGFDETFRWMIESGFITRVAELLGEVHASRHTIRAKIQSWHNVSSPYTFDLSAFSETLSRLVYEEISKTSHVFKSVQDADIISKWIPRHLFQNNDVEVASEAVLIGYLDRDNETNSLKIPVFESDRGDLYTCLVCGSFEILAFIRLDKAEEFFLRRLENNYRHLKRLYKISGDAPIVKVDGKKVTAKYFDDARGWILAAALNNQTPLAARSTYLDLLCISVPSVLMENSTCGPNVAHTVQSYHSAATTEPLWPPIGTELTSLRMKYTADLEQSVLKALSLDFQKELRNKRQLEASVMVGSLNLVERQSVDPLSCVLEALSGYFYSFKLLADGTIKDQNAAMRRLFGALGYLDEIRSKREVIKIIVRISYCAIFEWYCAIALYRFNLPGEEFGRKLSLPECVQIISVELASFGGYADAEARFTFLDRLLYVYDRRKTIPMSGALYGELKDDDGTLHLHTIAGESYQIDEEFASYDVRAKNRDGAGGIVRGEVLRRRGNTVATKGESYVRYGLDVYFPVHGYRGVLDLVLGAGRSWSLLVTSQKMCNELLAGRASHRALTRRLGLARFTLIPYFRDAVSQLQAVVSNISQDGAAQISFEPGAGKKQAVIFNFDESNPDFIARYMASVSAFNKIVTKNEVLSQLSGNIKTLLKIDNSDRLYESEAHLQQLIGRLIIGRNPTNDNNGNMPPMKLLLPIPEASCGLPRNLFEINPDLEKQDIAGPLSMVVEQGVVADIALV